MFEKIDNLKETLLNISKEISSYLNKAKSLSPSCNILKFGVLIKELEDFKNKIFAGDFGKSEDGSNPILRVLFDAQVRALHSQDTPEATDFCHKHDPRPLLKSKRNTVDESKTSIQWNHEGDTEEFEERDLMNEKQDSYDKAEAVDIIVNLMCIIANQKKELKIFSEKRGLGGSLEDFKLKFIELIRKNQYLTQRLMDSENEFRLALNNLTAILNLKFNNIAKKKDENYQFYVDFVVEDYKNFVKILVHHKLKIPYALINILKNINHEDLCVINTYLKSCFPAKASNLCISALNLGPALKLSYILPGLKNCLPIVSKQICIDHFKLRSVDLEEIMQNCFQAEELFIRYCKVTTSKLMNFQPKSSPKLKYLSFSFCGHNNSVSMDWQNHPNRFEYIIATLNHSSYKETLECINIHQCQLQPIAVYTMLHKNNLPHISCIDKLNEPLGVKI